MGGLKIEGAIDLHCHDEPDMVGVFEGTHSVTAVEAAREITGLVREFEAVLATGHTSAAEHYAVVREFARVGHVLVTHAGTRSAGPALSPAQCPPGYSGSPSSGSRMQPGPAAQARRPRHPTRRFYGIDVR